MVVTGTVACAVGCDITLNEGIRDNYPEISADSNFKSIERVAIEM